jgi:hypothetical protein
MHAIGLPDEEFIVHQMPKAAERCTCSWLTQTDTTRCPSHAALDHKRIEHKKQIQIHAGEVHVAAPLVAKFMAIMTVICSIDLSTNASRLNIFPEVCARPISKLTYHKGKHKPVFSLSNQRNTKGSHENF